MQVLLENPWFERLPEKITQQMMKISVIRQYKNADLIHQKGDEADGMFGIVAGVVRIANITAEGKEAVLTYLEPGSWFGDISLLDGLPRTHNAYAQGDSTILMLPRYKFLELMEKHPELYRHFNKLLCQRIRLLFSAMDEQSLLPLNQRLINHLLRLAATYGEKADQGIKIGLKLPQEELGLLLNTSRQSINKELKKLQALNLIKIAYGRLTLMDISRLKNLTNGGID